MGVTSSSYEKSSTPDAHASRAPAHHADADARVKPDEINDDVQQKLCNLLLDGSRNKHSIVWLRAVHPGFVRVASEYITELFCNDLNNQGPAPYDSFINAKKLNIIARLEQQIRAAPGISRPHPPELQKLVALLHAAPSRLDNLSIRYSKTPGRPLPEQHLYIAMVDSLTASPLPFAANLKFLKLHLPLMPSLAAQVVSWLAQSAAGLTHLDIAMAPVDTCFPDVPKRAHQLQKQLTMAIFSPELPPNLDSLAITTLPKAPDTVPSRKLAPIIHMTKFAAAHKLRSLTINGDLLLLPATDASAAQRDRLSDDLWELLALVPQLETAAVGKLTIDSSSSVAHHLSSLTAAELYIAAPLPRGCIAACAPKLQSLAADRTSPELWNVTAALSSSSSCLQHVSLGGDVEESEIQLLFDVFEPALSTIPNLRSIELILAPCKPTSDRTTMGSDLLRDIGGCRSLEELSIRARQPDKPVSSYAFDELGKSQAQGSFKRLRVQGGCIKLPDLAQLFAYGLELEDVTLQDCQLLINAFAMEKTLLGRFQMFDNVDAEALQAFAQANGLAGSVMAAVSLLVPGALAEAEVAAASKGCARVRGLLEEAQRKGYDVPGPEVVVGPGLLWEGSVLQGALQRQLQGVPDDGEFVVDGSLVGEWREELQAGLAQGVSQRWVLEELWQAVGKKEVVVQHAVCSVRLAGEPAVVLPAN